MDKWTIDVWFDGYRWASFFGGECLGMFATEREAYAMAYEEKCRMAGI